MVKSDIKTCGCYFCRRCVPGHIRSAAFRAANRKSRQAFRQKGVTETISIPPLY
jgi:hypothetical protein